MLMNFILINTNSNRLDYNFPRLNTILHKLCFKKIGFYYNFFFFVDNFTFSGRPRREF